MRAFLFFSLTPHTFSVFSTIVHVLCILKSSAVYLVLWTFLVVSIFFLVEKSVASLPFSSKILLSIVLHRMHNMCLVSYISI